MDFSSHNPTTSNALNLAARKNDPQNVRRLLKKMNPNCIDNRGWTCLHEAAASDSYESLVLILEHPDCRPLAESHEGHTALYLACRYRSSLKTITALLKHAEDIANYGSTECVTPLHIASAQGRVEVVQLLIDYGAMIDVQDFDGDTPLHDAASEKQPESVAVLLHAGADPEIKNDSADHTPFHLACYKGCFETVQILLPFISDINQTLTTGNTPLILAVQGSNEEIIEYLLKNGADPHLRNVWGESALDVALNMGSDTIFQTLLAVTDKDKLNLSLVLDACKPHYFKLEILEDLLNYNLGPEFFDFIEPFHISLEEIGDYKLKFLTNAPLNSYLNICEYIYSQSPDKFREFLYLFLTRGVAVDALDINECPPLVYIHFCMHTSCFREVFDILVEHGCNIDYSSQSYGTGGEPILPDALVASMIADASTAPVMLQHSVHCEPELFINIARDYSIIGRMSPQVITEMITLIDSKLEDVSAEALPYTVMDLKHLCRVAIRGTIRRKKPQVTTTQSHEIINHLPLPPRIKKYLRYL